MKLSKIIRSEVFWIMVLAIILRFLLLDIKPPHFDEGINGWFVDRMAKNGYFEYDPTNYHGPLYFYALFASLELLGRNLWALRLPAVVASLLAVFWMFRFRDFFGRRCAAWAAAAMAVSPACVFYGRYSIHESFLVFFMVLSAWGALGLLTDGNRKYMIATIIGITGMFLTKETWLIHAISFGLAVGCLLVWQRYFPSQPSLPFARQTWRENNGKVGITVIACLVAILFFFSGNFLRFDTLPGIVEAYAAWFKTGTDTVGHVKSQFELAPIVWNWLHEHSAFFKYTEKPPWLEHLKFLNYYWLYLFARYEWTAVMGVLACGVLLFKPTAGTIRLIAIYALGVLAAYSIIPYKTPWCILSLLWPFFLTFGYLVEYRRTIAATMAACVVLAASLAWCVRLNFFHYVDHSEPYVYVQTDPKMAVLTGPLLKMAAKDTENYNLSGQVLLESYYPIPWVLGDFRNVGYYKEIPAGIDTDFVVIEANRADLVESKFKEPYYRRTFLLRDAMGESNAYFRASKFADEFSSAIPEVIPAAKP